MKTQWGKWNLRTSSQHIPTLDYPAYPSSEYWIPLPVKTQEQINDWVSHISEKFWGTPKVLGDLREALEDLRNLTREQLDAIKTPPIAEEEDDCA